MCTRKTKHAKHPKANVLSMLPFCAAAQFFNTAIIEHKLLPQGGGCFLQNPIWRARDDGGPETTRSAFCFPECCSPLRVKHLRAPRLCRWSYRFQRKKFRVLDDIQACTRTVRFRGMGTDISEASKRVPISSFATQGGKQVSSHFRQGNWDKTSRLRPSRLEQSLSLG